MFLCFCPIFGLGHHLQIIYFIPLAKAFSIFWLGRHSHSDFLQKYGKNLHSTFPTQIQVLKVCDTVGGMTDINVKVPAYGRQMTDGRANAAWRRACVGCKQSAAAGSARSGTQPPPISENRQPPASPNTMNYDDLRRYSMIYDGKIKNFMKGTSVRPPGATGRPALRGRAQPVYPGKSDLIRPKL
jgi:hypothetical protein